MFVGSGPELSTILAPGPKSALQKKTPRIAARRRKSKGS
jgi:hypothetical protein